MQFLNAFACVLGLQHQFHQQEAEWVVETQSAVEVAVFQTLAAHRVSYTSFESFFFFFSLHQLASISREIIWTNTYVGNSMPNYPVDLTNGKSWCEWNLLYLLPVMAQRKIWKGQVTKLRTNLLNDCRFGFLVEFPFLMTLFEDWPRSRCKGLKPRPFLPVHFKFGAPCSDWPKIWDLVLRHHHQQAQ